MSRSRSATLSSAQPPSTTLSPSTHSNAPPPPDLFILVRPPPSTTTHPLNLQVQLLVPSSSRGGPSGGTSGRPLSVASSRSGRTTGTEAAGRSLEAVAGASVSRDGLDSAAAGEGEEGQSRPMSRSPSVSSTRSGRSSSGRSGSGVSYAGSETGSEAGAGRRKRRVQPLLNLAFHSVLPTVVTDAGTDERVAKFLKQRGIELTNLAIFDPVDLSSLSPPPVASTSTSTSTSSPASVAPPAPNPAAAAAGGGLFSRFKKLNLSGSPSKAASSPSADALSASSKLFASAPSDAPHPASLPLIRTPSSDPPPPSSSSPSPPSHGYAFLLRRWLRSDLSSSVPVGQDGGVRLEWARPARPRPRPRSAARPPSGEDDGAAPAEEEDSGDDSDPEDSDRPWVCTLVYPLSSSSSAASLAPAEPRASMSSARSRPSREPSPSRPLSAADSLPPPADKPRLRKLHLATLRPAPHHPHLISTLLLPPSLPSIPLGSFSPLRGLEGGSLAPEDLRDLAMVSALWVAVREGLGGLGGGERVREEGQRGALAVKMGLGGSGKKRGLFGR